MFGADPSDLAKRIAEGESLDIPALSAVLYGEPITSASQVGGQDFRGLDPASMRELRTGDRWVHRDDSTLWFPDYRSADNYLFLDMEDLDEKVAEFNAAALSGANQPLILAFFTGGTLAMVRGEKGFLTPAKDGSQLLEFAGHGLKDSAKVGIVKTPAIDSSFMKVMLTSEIVAAYHYISRKLSPEASRLFAGVVLGHGTDTAAGTAATTQAMHTAYNVGLGIVCGQRANDNPLPDGPSNIATTLLSLIQMHNVDVAMPFVHQGGGISGQLLKLGGVTKDSDLDVHIFGTRGYDLIADLGREGITKATARRLGRRRDDSGLAPIMLDGHSPFSFFQFHQNDDPRQIIKSVIETRTPFHVCTSFGAGTASQDAIRAMVFADLVLAERAKGGAPREHLFVNTLFTDANLRHSYESNEMLRKAGIVVLSATEDMLIAKGMMARAMTPDPATQRRYIITPMNGDYPASYSDYAREHYAELLLSDAERRGLRDKFELRPAA